MRYDVMGIDSDCTDSDSNMCTSFNELHLTSIRQDLTPHSHRHHHHHPDQRHRLAGFMELVPYKTTPESLSFNVRMVARLAAPLAFFYLGWLSENGIKPGDWSDNQAPSVTTYRNVSIAIPKNTTIGNLTFSPSTFPSTLLTAYPSVSLSPSFTHNPSTTHAPSTSQKPSIAPSQPRLFSLSEVTTSPSSSPTISSSPSLSPSPTIKSNSTYFPSAASNATISHNRTVLIATTIPGGLPMPSCFSHFYQLQAVSSLKSTFGTFFPVLLFCVMFLIATNILNHFLVLIRVDYLQFGAEIVTEDQLKEGKRQLERHKRSTVRTAPYRSLPHLTLLPTL